MKRTYRKWVSGGKLVSFQVQVKETDLWISSERRLEKEARDLVFEARTQVETYIDAHPEFMTSLVPWPADVFAPPLVRRMIQSASILGVGPMACVAGAIAQYVGEGLMEYCQEIIVENGGDIFLHTNMDTRIAIFAGKSPLSKKVGLVIKKDQMPIGVCSSSATIGHSLSMGIADVVTILSSSASFADGAATALCNRVKSKKDLEHVALWASEFEEIFGGVAIVHDKMTAWGQVELIAL